MAQADVGIIGGSGLYQMDALRDVGEIELDTPFGRPSDTVTLGTLDGVRVAFLPRHGRGHRLLPSEIPYRANVYAMKALGVSNLISISAVGSLREDYRPMDMVLPDQLYDRTKNRESTFFGGGIVAHVSFAEPFCSRLRSVVAEASRQVVARTHDAGTYVCMEGPAFSTRAESDTYRRLGFDIIGMTALPEAKLAREAGMCYAVLGQVTDYDCWHPDHAGVTGEMVMANVARNVANAKKILRLALPSLASARECGCAGDVDSAIATDRRLIAPDLLKKLDIIASRPRRAGTNKGKDLV
ncbi:MAG TPA: S-methyl-5'-thioadenosine phosphorylase [Chloroflexota bacterium]|nr:S-methyl-5'-thioadenosine phosphorylase [Chloroflexota bacterium]